jgi:hypothetical protein
MSSSHQSQLLKRENMKIKRRTSAIAAFEDFDVDPLQACRENLRQLRAVGVID